jgi:hypothetical protein
MSGLALAISHGFLRLYPTRYSLNRFRYSHAARRMLETSPLLDRNEQKPEAYVVPIR